MAGLSFAGVPPLGGFIGKYFVFTAALASRLSMASCHRCLNKRTTNRIHLPPHERHVLKETQRRNRHQRKQTHPHPRLHPRRCDLHLRLVPRHRLATNTASRTTTICTNSLSLKLTYYEQTKNWALFAQLIFVFSVYYPIATKYLVSFVLVLKEEKLAKQHFLLLGCLIELAFVGRRILMSVWLLIEPFFPCCLLLIGKRLFNES